MRVLLIRPDSHLEVVQQLLTYIHLEPLDLEYVAAAVPPQHEVNILDLTLEKRPSRKLKRILTEYKPDVIGFTAYSNQRENVATYGTIARQLCPEAFILLGGHHATIMPENCRFPFLDAIVRGEGYTTFKRMIDVMQKGDDVFSIPHVHRPFADHFGPVPIHPGISEIPHPRRDLVDRSRYTCVWSSPKKASSDSIFPRTAAMRTSFGCAYNCTFCVVPQLCGRKHHRRRVDDVLAELESIQETYVYFVDDETFLSPEYMRELAKGIQRRKINKRYVTWARSNTICQNPDLFELWQSVGLQIVYVGLESPDNSTLQKLNKKTSAEQNNEAVRVLGKIGITIHPAFMVMPDFSVEDFDRLKFYLKNLPPVEATFTVYSPSPGTDAWNRLLPEFICDPIRYYDCMHTILQPRLPLKTFYKHFSGLTKAAIRRNPLSHSKVAVNPLEVVKILWKTHIYIRIQRNLWQDYKQHGEVPKRISG